MIDYKQLKAGATVRLSDGALVEVKGSYMAADGLVLTLKPEPGRIAARNVHINDVVEVIDSVSQP